ncbi:MAG: hypothetical protein JO022_03870, partial [Acidobacteriaceae bacterium]|nr:hypothetical protein [Acidobacteriaceae bacterium]
MTRRQLLSTAVSAPALFSTAKKLSADSKPVLGGAPTAFSLRMRAARQENKPFDILEHCHQLGLTGVETMLPSKDPAAIKAFRQKAEQLNLRVILNAPLPKSQTDVAAFDSAVQACKECGAIALHAAMTARRYEQFDNFPAFKKNFEQNQLSVSLAEPILRKHRIRLAVENH